MSPASAILRDPAAVAHLPRLLAVLAGCRPAAIAPLLRALVRFALATLVLVALSIPGALTPGRSLSFLLKDYMRSVLLMLLIAASVRGLSDVRRFAWVQIVGVSLCALAILTHAEVGSEGRLSAEVTYYDANDLATLIVCTLPLVLYLWRRPTRWPGRLALAAATVFLMMTLGETGSRGGFLGFVVVAATCCCGSREFPAPNAWALWRYSSCC